MFSYQTRCFVLWPWFTRINNSKSARYSYLLSSFFFRRMWRGNRNKICKCRRFQYPSLCTKFAASNVRKSKRISRMFVRTVRTFGNGFVVVRNEFREKYALADVHRQRREYKINFCVDAHGETNFHSNWVFGVRPRDRSRDTNGSNAFWRVDSANQGRFDRART